jgi:transcriptional regulator with XRE-family HTH domain
MEKHFGLYVKKIRKNRKRSGANVSRAIGFERTYISKLERNVRPCPNQHVANHILEELGVPKEEIVSVLLHYELISREDDILLYYPFLEELDKCDPFVITKLLEEEINTLSQKEKDFFSLLTSEYRDVVQDMYDLERKGQSRDIAEFYSFLDYVEKTHKNT